MRAHPDAIVLLCPTPWELTEQGVTLGAEQLKETYMSTWSESIEQLHPFEQIGENEFTLGFQLKSEIEWEHIEAVQIVVESPIPELVTAERYSLEPLAPTEQVRISQHKSLWRIVIPEGEKYGFGNAILAAKWMETMCRAHSPCIFLPGSMRLHPVGVVRTLTADYQAPNAIANLFISAWHKDKVMSTRGLTSLGLPELTTPINAGHNGSYFRLMDLATEMLISGKKYTLGSQLELGRERFKIGEPIETIQDELVPTAGHYGYQRIIPL